MEITHKNLGVFKKMRMIHNLGYRPVNYSFANPYQFQESSRYHETRNLALKRSLLYKVLLSFNLIFGVVFMAVIAGLVPVQFKEYSLLLALGVIILFLLCTLFQIVIRYYIVSRMSVSEIEELNTLIDAKAQNGLPATRSGKKLGAIVIITIIVAIIIVIVGESMMK